MNKYRAVSVPRALFNTICNALGDGTERNEALRSTLLSVANHNRIWDVTFQVSPEEFIRRAGKIPSAHGIPYIWSEWPSKKELEL